MSNKVLLTIDKLSLDYSGSVNELDARNLAMTEWPSIKYNKTSTYRSRDDSEFGVMFYFKAGKSEVIFHAGESCYTGTATGPMADELAALVLNAWGGVVDITGTGGPGVAWRSIPDRSKLDAFTTAYIDAALSTSTDESREDGGDPLDRNYNVWDLSPLTLRRAFEVCSAFQRQNHDAIARAVSWREDQGLPGNGWAQAGYDFWLTRNGHGTGFWDDGRWPEMEGKLLDAASKAAGAVDLLLDDNGKIISSESWIPGMPEPGHRNPTLRPFAP